MKSTRRDFLGGLLAGSAAGMTDVITDDHLEAAQVSSESVVESVKLPIRREVDLCVLGGSCTGVFAAVRAARLGAKVAVIERQNCFGGVATSAMVNVWHSLFDTVFEKKIIGGLTEEVIERLKTRNAVTVRDKNESIGYIFNSAELMIELDELVLEAGVIPYLHTLFSEPFYENGKLAGVVIDGKSGRGVIKARYFIDATGDGDLCARLGVPFYYHDSVQPPTTCVHLSNFNSNVLHRLLKDHADEFHLKKGFSWGEQIPGTPNTMFAGTRVYHVRCDDADDLTKAEIEGRRQIRALMDMVRQYGPKSSGKDSNKKNSENKEFQELGLVALPSCIGIRESRHFRCLHSVTDEEALHGIKYEDTIARGSYRFDIHHQEKSGVTFSYLDGTRRYIDGDHKVVVDRWRPKTEKNPTWYEFPLRSLIPVKTENVLLAGRMFDAERHTFSGMRVMVNMNQLGEAAGVTALLALEQNKSVAQINPREVRNVLKKGGSLLFD